MEPTIRTCSVSTLTPCQRALLKAEKARRFLKRYTGASAIAGALLCPTLVSGKSITVTGNVQPDYSSYQITDWILPDYVLSIAPSGTGTLIMTGGATIWCEDGTIGGGSNAVGTLLVDGVGTLWQSDALVTGHNGEGTMRISNGAKVFNLWGTIAYISGSKGTVMVNGAGSIWENFYELEIGKEGSGLLRISDGGTVLSRDGYIGYHTGSDGTVTVEGAKSKWVNSAAIYLGNAGKGTLTVGEGGNVSNSVGYIGNEAGSIGAATVKDSASTWSNTGMLYVGFRGIGELTISNGGNVSSKDGAIGRHSGSTGEVTITGVNSKWTNTGNLYVGYDGTGTLTVEEKGIAEVAGTIAITADSSLVLKSGGTLRSSSDQADWITGSGAFTLASGGGLIDTQNHTVTISKALTGVGSLTKVGAGTLALTGTNTYSGGTTIQGGRLDITTNANLGDAASKLTINNATLHNSANLVMDREIVIGTGNATLDVENGYLTLRTPMSGSGGLIKTGGNILTLTGDNTYTGATIIQKGSFKVEKGTLASTSVTLAKGTTFYMQNLVSYSGEISGEGDIEKSGQEKTTLTGTNTYTGTTTIAAGNLVVNGSIAGSTLTTVRSGATLSGNGTVGNLHVASGGILSPGNSTGLLTVDGDLTLDSAAVIMLEIASLTDFDRILVNGGITLGGTLMLNFADDFTLEATTDFDFFGDSYTQLSGAFVNIEFSTSGYHGVFDYDTGSFSVVVVAVPEPSTYGLVIAVSAILIAWHRRRGA